MRTAPPDTSAPMPPPRAPRGVGDRCPTAVKLHPAADGLIARVRLPGGRLSCEQAELLASWADVTGAAGADRIEVTGRGNLQLRGLRADQAAPLAAALFEAGLLPSEPHDQARTINASPLAGRLPGSAAADELVRELDSALCAAPALTALSGRFRTAVDDGTGMVDLASADLGLQLHPGDADRVALVVGGAVAGRLPRARAAEVFVAAATAFLEAARGAAWQVRELADGGAGVVAQLRDAGFVEAAPASGSARGDRVDAPVLLPPLGPGQQTGGLGYVRALLPLGRLTGDQLASASALAVVAAGELRLAADRSLTIPDVPLRFLTPTVDGLAAAGLLVTDADPAAGLTACAGLGCASSRGDVRAAAALRRAARGAGAPREHLVGCDRRCGAPARGDAQTTFVLADGELPQAFAARVAAAQETTQR